MLINYASRIAHCLAAASIYKSITRNLKFIPTSPLCLYAIRYLDIPPVQPLPPLPPPPRRQRTPPSPSFLFISAKFPPHQPQPSTPPPPPSLPSQSHHRHAKPPSTRPVTYPRTPPTKRQDGSDGGSYGINKSGAHAPQLPSLLPSAATTSPLPSSIPSSRTFTVQPAYSAPCLSRLPSHSLSLSFFAVDIPLLFPCDGFSFSPLHTAF